MLKNWLAQTEITTIEITVPKASAERETNPYARAIGFERPVNHDRCAAETGRTHAFCRGPINLSPMRQQPSHA
jgi:hypothetical protein